MNEDIVDDEGQAPESQPATPENNPTTSAPEQGAFSLPEEYRDKGWAKNIKTQDDVFKMLDHSQSLIGKKTIGIPDFGNASESEIEDFYSKLRPESAEEYNLEGLDEQDNTLFKDAFYKLGLSKHQADNLIETYKKSIEEAYKPLFSEDGYKKEMANRFGDKTVEVTNKVNNFLKTELSSEDKEIVEKLPNNVLGVIYDVVNRIVTRYAINDSDIGKGGGNSGGGVSNTSDISAYVQEMEALKSHPHTVEERDAIMRKYNMK